MIKTNTPLEPTTSLKLHLIDRRQEFTTIGNKQQNEMSYFCKGLKQIIYE
jgi:hypothetical protein